MNEYTKRNIIGNSWHQFLYGYYTVERTNFLKEIAKEYPITLNRDCPQAIYMEEFSLPPLKCDHKVDKDLLKTASEEYLDFCIYTQLLDEVFKRDFERELNGREQIFLEYVNNFLLDSNFNKIENLSSLRDALLKARNFYQQFYVSTITGESLIASYDELPIPHIPLQESYMRKFKNMINNSSYFALIIDAKEKLPVISQRAINGYVTKRITSYFSMKVACDPNEWVTYYDLEGEIAESPHDYMNIELDDSLKNQIEQRKKEFYKKYE